MIGMEPKSSSRFVVETLAKSHDRAMFSCGDSVLDRYLRLQASQDASKRVAVCFVLTPDSKLIAGFYTLSQYSVELEDMPPALASSLPKYPQVPATLLGRFAIDQKFSGRKLGEFMLLDVLARSLRQSKQIASVFIVVDAKNESARHFYQHYNFISLPNSPKRLFLLMKTVEKLFAELG